VIGAFTENVLERVKEEDEEEEKEQPGGGEEEEEGEECMQGAVCGAAGRRTRVSATLVWVVVWGTIWNFC
jgi:hypothetical protein